MVALFGVINLKHALQALLFLAALISTSVFGWNAVGHRLIAVIAYDQMSPRAKREFNHYNHALDKVYKPQSWMNAAVWLDTLRYQDVSWFETVHYIDFPISDDNRQLPVQEVNALWAIEKASVLLLNKYANDFDKGIALRVLLHVVGDIHQPLHTATKISSGLPQGDKGGNLVPLRGTPVARNLHAYWDRGAGFLNGRHLSANQIKQMARRIEQNYPCSRSIDINPMLWAKESHALAINAYKNLGGRENPSQQYQEDAQKITIKQIALAGCRLGALLNQLTD